MALKFSTYGGGGRALVAIAALFALVVSLFLYFDHGDGIAYTAGTLLVVLSSALVLLATVAELLVLMPRWTSVTLDVLVALAILGTGLADYFLEADVPLALMMVAGVGWLVAIAGGNGSFRVAQRRMAS